MRSSGYVDVGGYVRAYRDADALNTAARDVTLVVPEPRQRSSIKRPSSQRAVSGCDSSAGSGRGPRTPSTSI